MHISLQEKGFTAIELTAVVVLIGILATVAIPRITALRTDAEQASVATMVSTLESAMAIHSAQKFVKGQRPTVHNPFNDLTNIPIHYNGVFDRISVRNTPKGTWSYDAVRNWVVYNPQISISGGWEHDENRFIVYQVEVIVQYLDTVGMRLGVNPVHEFSWN